ncbi:MAG TPA: thioredoxin [Sphingobium sp.]|uniref:thioredoxin n=1 Tax=Sphingobium sp. TaxID=1912891 RepID=UPI002ED6040E
MTEVKEVSESLFQGEIMESKLPVLVDFYAQWCGPCKAMAPALADLALEYEGQVRVVKIDIDAAPGIADAYGIASVPTFLLIRGGEVAARFSGAQTRSKIAAILDTAVEQRA